MRAGHRSPHLPRACDAAASLRPISTTDAIEPWATCLALADRWGWREALHLNRFPRPDIIAPTAKETPMRTLDTKLAAIQAGTYKPADFIIADAKDGDIGFGRAAPGARPRRPTASSPARTHLQAIRDMTASGLVDIMLMSASTGERLSEEGLFKAAGHAGDPAQRHHRHLVGARRPLQARSRPAITARRGSTRRRNTSTSASTR